MFLHNRYLFAQTGKNEINCFVKNFVFKYATLRLYSENVNVQVFVLLGCNSKCKKAEKDLQ